MTRQKIDVLPKEQLFSNFSAPLNPEGFVKTHNAGPSPRASDQ